MTESGICLICGQQFEREVKEDGRKRLGCGECGESPKQMAKSMFLYSSTKPASTFFIDKDDKK